MVLSTIQHMEQVGSSVTISQEDLAVEEQNFFEDRVFNIEALDLTVSNPSEGHYVYQTVTEARVVQLRPPELIGHIPRPVQVQSSYAYHQTRRNFPSARVQRLVAEARGRERGKFDQLDYVPSWWNTREYNV